MSDFTGSPAQLKDKAGNPTGEWGAWVNDLGHIGNIRQWKADCVGQTVTARTKAGEEREETIAEVLYVQLPEEGSQDLPSMLVRFGSATAPGRTSGNRSELAQALLNEMKALRKDIQQLRISLRDGRTPSTAPGNDDDDLPF